MSGEDSKQLSVAELLARNAAQGASPPSGGGGRRRRSGRGLSVNDLTGENAAVKPNSHAAPAPEPAAPTYHPAPEPASYEPPASYAPPASYEPAPYPPPGPAEPAFSPMSGPITRFDPHSGFSAPDPNDPLGVAGPRPSSDPFGPFRAEARDTSARPNGRGPGRLGAPGSAQPVDPGIAEMFGSGALPAVPGAAGGRRRRPDPEEVPEPPQAPPVTGGRAARRRAAEAAEEAAAVPVAEPSGYTPAGYDYEPPSAFDGRRDAPPFNGYPGADAPGFGGYPDAGPAFGPRPDSVPGFGGFADVDAALGRRQDNATQAFEPSDAPQARGTGWPQAPEADQRPSLDRRRSEAGKKGGLPSWSARRHRPDAEESAPDSGGFATAAWSPVSQEQPLISGQSVAGDLLRQRADDADARTEVYRVGGEQPGADPDTDDYAESDYVDRDYADNDYSDAEYDDGEYDDEDDYDDDYEPEPKPTRASRRAATKAAASKVARRAKSRAASRMAASRVGASRVAAGRLAAGRLAAGRAGARSARTATDDANRRQWLILAGQSVGAAVAGMLLFKGFETMWETLPWVALALAMVVILGLVALVRVLRRTDDIFSTVIAVVVGVFVTLGPLAFLLSTS
ncbi:hypothetical protein [Nocardia sp. NPDC058497]|uniref:hypothetical protein n=1 Tax=Nocardia sp. NPDC058497 TaxID=3346529 RepID=UPI00365ACDCC